MTERNEDAIAAEWRLYAIGLVARFAMVALFICMVIEEGVR